jgi:hypothetical protein
LELHSTDVTDVKVTVNGFEHFDFRYFAFENNRSRTVVLAARGRSSVFSGGELRASYLNSVEA